MPGFDAVSSRYARDSTVQRTAAEVLLRLAPVGPRDDVLDVGCGTGALVARVRALTSGRVVGVDPSAGMIAAARRDAPPGVALERRAAEDLPYRAEFDLALSNSALQWFHDVARALARVRAALRPGGRAAIQAPATRLYCPEFVEAMEDVARDPRTAAAWATFRSPWFFRESADAYAALLEAADLRVSVARVDELVARETPEGALRVYGSGAAQGYLDPDCYPAPLPAGFADAVRDIVRAALARRAGADGRLDLRFRRVFLVARAA
ncbi:MAG TPA: methyltransferase domain-containing protein [Anaeromyxobacter sp.]|nr:methyltransferase domain-containing protein [Anaeromyxobacter sp.]